MQHWDWVQWYYFVFICLTIVVTFIFDGQPKTGNHSLKALFLGFFPALPVIGRIFKWW